VCPEALLHLPREIQDGREVVGFTTIKDFIAAVSHQVSFLAGATKASNAEFL
jgi:hypothetical protein